MLPAKTIIEKAYFIIQWGVSGRPEWPSEIRAIMANIRELIVPAVKPCNAFDVEMLKTA